MSNGIPYVPTLLCLHFHLDRILYYEGFIDQIFRNSMEQARYSTN